MRPFLKIIAALLGFLFVLAIVWNRVRPADHAIAPLAQDAYIWQRDWTPAVLAAVADQQSQFHRLVVLTAEISFRSSSPKVTVIHPDYTTLVKSVRQIGIAIRLGPMAGSSAYQPASEQTKMLCKTAVDAMVAPRAAGLFVSELQIDFDCAESKLPGYRNWIAAAKKAVAPTPVVITALPSWLKHLSFSDLAHEAGSFVIQVHSLHQPAGPDASLTICDPAEAERAVADAAKIGVPFRVALPTYSYLAGFSTEGKFLGLSAEGPLVDWTEGTMLRPMRSDPARIAPLVARWIAHPPPHMIGIIWYRLPVAGDSMNWAAVTLRAVMAGRVPQANLVTELEHPKPGLVDVFVKNTGDADFNIRLVVSTESEEGFILSEGINGFDRLEDPSGSVIFRDSNTEGRRIAPGERIQVGWLRLATDREVHAHVTAAQNP